jgi:hypothetical protein
MGGMSAVVVGEPNCFGGSAAASVVRFVAWTSAARMVSKQNPQANRLPTMALATTPEERSQRTPLLAASGCRVRRADSPRRIAEDAGGLKLDHGVG